MVFLNSPRFLFSGNYWTRHLTQIMKAGLFAGFLCIALVAAQQAPPIPHLAQAWIAQSTGDGEPGATGSLTYMKAARNHPTLA